MKYVHRPETQDFGIYGGISIKDNQVQFNWTSDDSNDVIHLVQDCSGEFDDDGVRYFYGYEYTPHAKGEDKRIFRKYIKSLSTDGDTGLYSENIDEFVENAVVKFDSACPLSSFGATVHVESNKEISLVDVMWGYLWEYMHNVDMEFELVKEAYDNVRFDTAKAFQALIDSGMSESQAKRTVTKVNIRFNDFKAQGKLFQMKAFVPREIRSGFTNFLKFKSEEERRAYEALQGTNVLIFDDLLTSGATIKEVIRYLKAIHDKNTLTVFVLVKQ